MTKTFRAFGCAFALLFSAASPASPVTRTFSFTATNFGFAFGSPGPAPVDPAAGVVSVTFDDAIDQVDSTTGVNFKGFNFAVDSVDAIPGFSFSPVDKLLLIGTVCLCGNGGVTAIGPDADSFLLGIMDPAGKGSFALFAFSQSGFPDIALANSGTIAAVPDTPTWLALTVGFGAVGVAVRRAPNRSRALSAAT
jgi:hypothetical protein